jgi:hypothetical protein
MKKIERRRMVGISVVNEQYIDGITFDSRVSCRVEPHVSNRTIQRVWPGVARATGPFDVRRGVFLLQCCRVVQIDTSFDAVSNGATLRTIIQWTPTDRDLISAGVSTLNCDTEQRCMRHVHIQFFFILSQQGMLC